MTDFPGFSVTATTPAEVWMRTVEAVGFPFFVIALRLAFTTAAMPPTSPAATAV